MTRGGLSSRMCKRVVLYISIAELTSEESMVVSPYGFWSSPITSDLVVTDTIRLDQIALDGDAIYWVNLSRRSKADTSSTASFKGKSLSLLRLIMRTTSMFELACTNTAADHLLCRMGPSISPTSLISGFIGKMSDNNHAPSRHFGRMRFDMQMASLTAGAIALFAYRKTIRFRVRSSTL
jgi:hypothetical protein